MALAAAVTVHVSPAAASAATFGVMNTSESLPDGVWFRNSPSQDDTSREPGFGVFIGEQLVVDCWANGDPVGPYNNHTWYRALDVSRPIVNGHTNYGYMNTHYVSDGMSADQVYPGIPACSGVDTPPPPPPSVTLCVFAYKWPGTTVTWNYKGAHRFYGNAWQGASNWNAAGTGIRLVAVPNTARADISFRDVFIPNPNLLGHTSQPAGWTSSVPYDRAYSYLPAALASPIHIDILLNQFALNRWNDFTRTFTATHELGHALGLAHSDACLATVAETSIMRGGSLQPVNAPQYFDRIELEELYGLPTQ